MLHYQIDSELNHFERVISDIANGPFPLAYWQKRLAALNVARAVPRYRVRIDRLRDQLNGLDCPGGLNRRDGASASFASALA